MDTPTVFLRVIMCYVIVYAQHDQMRSDDTLADIRQPDHPRRPLNYIDPYMYKYNTSNINGDALTKIQMSLDMISEYIRRPQPALSPQPSPPHYPIYSRLSQNNNTTGNRYIPIPVPKGMTVNVKNGVSPNSSSYKKAPIIETRFPLTDDPNQNWGFAMFNQSIYDDDTVEDRPISFDILEPIREVPSTFDGITKRISFGVVEPERQLKRPAPPVEHGSSQANIQSSTSQAPIFKAEGSSVKSPKICDAAILSCCGESKKQQRPCFTNLGCRTSYLNGESCSADTILAAIDSFKNAYQPI